MPIKLNVGLAQKIGEANYGSRGASIDLEIELDSTLVLEPDKLRDRIRQLFALVRTSLAEELKGGSQQNAPALPSVNPPTAAVTPTPNGNGKSNGRANGMRLATPPQITKIRSLIEAQKLDLDTVLRERYHVQRPEELTVRQASDLIDSLKAPIQPHSA